MLREASETDVADILSIYGPFILESAVSFEHNVPSETEMWERINEIQRTLPWLVMEDAGKVIGYAYASEHRQRASYQWTKEVSVYVHPKHRKMGVAKGLYDALFKILALQGVCNLLAGLTLPNEASQRFHECMGFRQVGVYHGIGHKFGNWHDVMWLEKRLTFENDSAFIPIRELPKGQLAACLNPEHGI